MLFIKLMLTINIIIINRFSVRRLYVSAREARVEARAVYGVLCVWRVYGLRGGLRLRQPTRQVW